MPEEMRDPFGGAETRGADRPVPRSRRNRPFAPARFSIVVERGAGKTEEGVSAE